jgi:hypothetical protein
MNISFHLFSWAEENIPHYYKRGCDHAKPYLELAWDVCLIVGHQLHNMYENIHAYAEEKTPAVIEWVSHLNVFPNHCTYNALLNVFVAVVLECFSFPFL